MRVLERTDETDDRATAVDTVYELNSATGGWVGRIPSSSHASDHPFSAELPVARAIVGLLTAGSARSRLP
jgi:hypothetical protein